MSSKSIAQVNPDIIAFMGHSQLHAIRACYRGEEGDFFKAKMREYTDRIATMPKTYEQDGLGDQAIVYLHYFTARCDWYITERDSEAEQLQAFGLADLGYGPELGYIDITEILRNGAELDLYFTPRPVSQLKTRLITEPMYPNT